MSTQRQIRDEPLRIWILRYLERCPDAQTTTQVTKGINHVRDYRDVRRALEDLIKSGHIIRGHPSSRRASTYFLPGRVIDPPREGL